MSNVKSVTTDAFEREVLSADLPVVVDFFATWCGPCKMLGPILEKLAASHEGKIKFVKVDVDEEPALAEACDITGVPTLVIVKDGRVMDRVVGLMSPRALEDKLSRHVESRTSAAPA
jgi:thioredoxin 1